MKSKLTKKNIIEIKKIFEFPKKYREFRVALYSYIDKTDYKLISSLEQAVLTNKIVNLFKIKPLHGQDISLYGSKDEKEYSPYQIAEVLFPGGYFCNFTSIFFHELTNQVPSKVFVAEESARRKDEVKNISEISLSDSNIARAFFKPHRESEKLYKFQKYEIFLNEKVFRNKTGVETMTINSDYWGCNYQITCLERALIDAVVNPQYNGGITNVKEYYNNASAKINADKFLEIYRNLHFIYPYWQAIGLFAEKAGMTKLSDTLYKAFEMKNKFYLDHEAKLDWKFDEKWNTFYPGYLL